MLSISTGRAILYLLLFIPSYLLAGTNSCQPANGSPASSIGDFGEKSITDPEQNQAGAVFNSIASWSTGSHCTLTCDCSTTYQYNRYFSGLSNLPVESTDGDKVYYKVNDYISTAIQIYIAGEYKGYKYVPFNNESNRESTYRDDCTTGATDVTTGNSGKIDIKITRSFVGTSYFNNTHIADVYMNKEADAPNTIPYMNVYLSGVVTVPQNCIINAGTQVAVDLGSFYEGDFKTVGQKPEGYTPKTFNVPIKCNDVTASANLTLRIQGTSATGFSDALQSDNTDVGVVITDSSGNTLHPNDTTSIIPFTLDSGSEANITLHAYPVGTTGNAPTPGVFTTLAYLRVDFS